MNEFTSSDLKRIANLCLDHAYQLSREDSEVLALDYFRFAKAILEERYRKFAD